MEKVKAVGGGGGGGGSSVLPNCICALIENGFKECETNRDTSKSRQLPGIVTAFLGHSFVSRCCKCLLEAVSRNDSAATQAWLSCCKSMFCTVTSVLPADLKNSPARKKAGHGKGASPHTPLESPPPVARGGGDAWGSSILSPGDLERMNLRGEKNGGKGSGVRVNQRLGDQGELLDTCRQVVDEFAASSILFSQALSHFDSGASHRGAIDDLSSWLLSAVATLSSDVCFEKWIDDKSESKAINYLADTVRAYLNSNDRNRVLVRAVRVLNMAAMTGGVLLTKISNNHVLLDNLRKLLSVSSSDRNGKSSAKTNGEAVQVATQLLSMLTQYATTRKIRA